MKKTYYPDNSERVELEGFPAEFREALEQELDAIEKGGMSAITLTTGRQLEQHGAEFWYRFNVEYAPSMPADTPCKLIVGKEQFEVTVVSFEENAIILASKNPLPPTLGSARLENGSTVLIERLIRCIEEESKKSNPAGERMFRQADGAIYQAKIISHLSVPKTDKLNSEQNDAVESALQNDITFIWGPPGTGKTSVIGEIIKQLYMNDRSVLVVSHTNTAVDGAIKKAVAAYDKIDVHEKYFPILRLGISENVDRRASMDAHVKELGSDLADRKAKIEKRQAEIHAEINKIDLLIRKNDWIKSSRILEIKQLNDDLQLLLSEEKNLQYEAEKIDDALQSGKKLTPEYSEFTAISKALEDAGKEHAKAVKILEATKAMVAHFPARIQHIEDEIKKHFLYAELKSKEEKLMSEQFLLEEITAVKDRIAELERQIKKYKSDISAYDAAISKYQSKGSLGKLFAGRSAYEQAQREKTAAEDSLEKNKTELKTRLRLLAEYEQQLEDLRLLKIRIKAIEPTETKAYWEAEKQLLEQQLASSRAELPKLDATVSGLAQKISDLEKRKAELFPACDRIARLEQDKDAVEIKLDHLREDREATEQTFLELLDQERASAAFFNGTRFSSGDDLIDALFQEYTRARDELIDFDIDSDQEKKKHLNEELVNLSNELSEIGKKMALLEKQAVDDAKIIGATLTKAYLSDLLRGRTFDTVILDEASMAAVPALWCASYLAEKNIVIVGDFLQLPPIVISNGAMAQKWLGRDIFDHSGMQEAAKEKTAPQNFIMLSKQYRMEKDIADIANMYYGDYCSLETAEPDDNRKKAIENFYAWYGGNRTNGHVHLIDTESLHAWVTGIPQGGNSHSRLNSFSAAVDVDLAFKFLEKKLTELTPDEDEQEDAPPFVLIVAPYKPHVKRIQQLVELEYKNRGYEKDLNLISVGTIHSFQGREADIVIFDLVIDEPHWRANLFVNIKDDKDAFGKGINEDLKRMFNVAVTRAKYKLFIVGNFAYCQKRAKENALGVLLKKLLDGDRLPKIDAKALLPNITFSRDHSVYQGELPANHIVCRDVDFDEYFMRGDLKSFRERAIIYSPFMTENRLSLLLPVFADSIQKGKKIIVITKAQSDRGKRELAQYLKCEKELKDIGVTVLHKQGMHEKTIIFDDDVVWNGSLNALSFTGLTGEIMHRFKDKGLTAVFEKDLDIEHLRIALENRDELSCPICNGEMMLKESSGGGFYWQCVNDDYSRSADQQYPRDGILRCGKCGAPFVFSMKTEPRWVCSQDPKHPQQKIRETDQKLEKMAALIPKSRKKEVDRFFAAKRKEKEAAAKEKSSGSGKSKAQKQKQKPAKEGIEGQME